MSSSSAAILFFGYCWTEETSRPWEIGVEDPVDSEQDWEERYAAAKGLIKTEGLKATWWLVSDFG